MSKAKGDVSTRINYIKYKVEEKQQATWKQI